VAESMDHRLILAAELAKLHSTSPESMAVHRFFVRLQLLAFLVLGREHLVEPAGEGSILLALPRPANWVKLYGSTAGMLALQ
jgi:hypothetical protein